MSIGRIIRDFFRDCNLSCKSYWPNNGTREGLILSEQTLKLIISGWLFPLVTLLHLWAYLTRPIITVTHRIHNCLRLIIAFLLIVLLAPSSAMKSKEYGWSLQISSTLIFPCSVNFRMLSIMSYCQALGGNQ